MKDIDIRSQQYYDANDKVNKYAAINGVHPREVKQYIDDIIDPYNVMLPSEYLTNYIIQANKLLLFN